MWNMVRALRAMGVTIILTTHYIAEAEEMADRVECVDQGEIILVEEKTELMRKLGSKRLKLQLQLSDGCDTGSASAASPGAQRRWG